MLAPAFVFAGLAGLVFGKMEYVGVAIAGADFGCDIDGSCALDTMQLPLTSLGGGDGAGQMKHFVEDDKMNMFRIPVPWQFLVSEPGATIDSGNFSKYDQIVQACLSTGAYCMIDVHNFARYDGGIIGQGGPTDDQFADLWSQLATHYADEETVVFEVVNEPHDLDINLWAQTCQAVINAIRKAGAKTQMILLPGTNFASAGTVATDGSGDALLALTNPDGSTDNLLLDIHKYLDINNSGTHEECTTNNTEAFRTVAAYLRKAGRKGIVSETGASSDATKQCMVDFCAQNEVIFDNSDVLVGFVAWGAGSFKTDYVLSLTPSTSNGEYVDNDVMKQCILAPWNDSKDAVSSSSTAVSATSSTRTASSSSSTSTSTASSTAATAALVTGSSAVDASAAGASNSSSSSDSSSSAGKVLAGARTRTELLGTVVVCAVLAGRFL
ncbi:Endoglucanase VIII [Pleurostoma richardsiae]|uniref:Endoglucanase EG-II n=1 Tax=Pleurostoma richardsiae TaxID=41990 RepID=A0AA38RCP2_9PEZI|nr:Endoglucanase VIII [Pleurostoma richardsiae]